MTKHGNAGYDCPGRDWSGRCFYPMGHRDKHPCSCSCALGQGHKSRHRCEMDEAKEHVTDAKERAASGRRPNDA